MKFSLSTNTSVQQVAQSTISKSVPPTLFFFQRISQPCRDLTHSRFFFNFLSKLYTPPWSGKFLVFRLLGKAFASHKNWKYIFSLMPFPPSKTCRKVFIITLLPAEWNFSFHSDNVCRKLYYECTVNYECMVLMRNIRWKPASFGKCVVTAVSLL